MVTPETLTEQLVTELRDREGLTNWLSFCCAAWIAWKRHDGRPNDFITARTDEICDAINARSAP